MTRDTYAKELIKAAEAAFSRNESPTCPHENCREPLSVVTPDTFSTRSLLCPVHGRIYQEQENSYDKLDWDKPAAMSDEFDEIEDDEDDCEEEDDL